MPTERFAQTLTTMKLLAIKTHGPILTSLVAVLCYIANIAVYSGTMRHVLAVALLVLQTVVKRRKPRGRSGHNLYQHDTTERTFQVVVARSERVSASIVFACAPRITNVFGVRRRRRRFVCSVCAPGTCHMSSTRARAQWEKYSPAAAQHAWKH